MNKYTEESRSFKPWHSSDPPNRILIIRFYAVGDVAITFPSCRALREQYPDSQIDFLTYQSNTELPQATNIFNQIYGISDGNGRAHKLMEVITWGYKIRKAKYDVIIDLQRNRISRIIRILANPLSWGEFDRFSPKSACTRTLEVFHEIGFTDLQLCFEIPLKKSVNARAKDLLLQNGWNGYDRLVILNPAGRWATRNWPLDHYVKLAQRIRSIEPVNFLFLGTKQVNEKAKYLSCEIGDRCIDLTGKTSLTIAIASVQMASMIVSEDSGLMHIAWASGVPTIALLGSSRHDWSRPVGPHSRCLHSGDLACGACMEPQCRYGDVHCLSRHLPETVFDLYKELRMIQKPLHAI